MERGGIYLNNALKISDSEWKIMKVLWQEPHLSLGEIVGKLKADTSWSSTTIRTMIGRLMGKGVVGADKSHNNFRFFPLASQKDCQQTVAESFVDRAFEGSISLMVAALLSGKKIHQDELAELKQIIETME